MLLTRVPRVAVAALVLAAIACGDPTKPKATIPSAASSYTLYALTGAPVNAPTALILFGGLTRVDVTFSFDLAVDLTPGGQVIVYPVRAIAGGLPVALKRVGLQVVPGGFDAVRDVPLTGYDTLATQTVSPGTVLAVELLESSCQFSLGGAFLYAKVVVDSIVTAPNRVYLSTVVDPNCGYRQVMADTIPEF